MNSKLTLNILESEIPRQPREKVLPKYVVRPAPLPEDLSSTEEDSDNSNEEESKDERAKLIRIRLKKFRKQHGPNLALERDVIQPVLKYLKRSDILNCMLVCRLWQRWAFDPAFWKTIDLTRKRINSTILKGIVLRQPLHLNLR